MTVAADRTIDNTTDVNRKIPASALSNQVITELEGVIAEPITGPAADATVELSRPVSSIVAVLSYVTATGDLVAVEGAPNVVSLFKLPTTHWTLVKSNANGVGALTEAASVDNSANTWLVLYKADAPAETEGGQSSVTP